MRPEEITGLGDLAGDAAAGATRQIHEMHTGIARRVWRRVGPAAIPVRIAHDRIAERAYTAAGELTRAVVRAGANAASATLPPDAPSVQRSAAGRAVVSALNGAFGDTLERRGNPLALRMCLPARRARPRAHATGARRRVPERQVAAGGVRPRPVRDRRRLELDTRPPRVPRPLWPPDGDRARLQPAVPALQHRPPHLRERPRARATRSTDLSPPGRPTSTRSC